MEITVYVPRKKEAYSSRGGYPEVSLSEARAKLEDIRRIVKNGDDPSELRKKQKIETKENAVNTFEKIANEWFAKKRANITPGHALCVMRRLKLNVFPFLGDISIKKITPKELLEVIRILTLSIRNRLKKKYVKDLI